MADPTTPRHDDDVELGLAELAALEPVFDPFDALAVPDPWLDGVDGVDGDLALYDDEDLDGDPHPV